MLRYLSLLFAWVRGFCRVLVRRVGEGPLHPDWGLRTELVLMFVRTTLAKGQEYGNPWLRELEEWMPASSSACRACEMERTSIGELSALWCRPKQGRIGQRTILFFHGGGYVNASSTTHADLMARLALGSGADVLGVDYRLAPENVFPAMQDDALAAWEWLRARGVPASDIALAGDSSGGSLCLTTLLRLRDAGEEQPVGAALISPWIDPFADGGSMVENAKFDVADRGLLVEWGEMMLGDGDPDHPWVNLARAQWHGIAPLHVQVSELEVLRDQIESFAGVAEAAGVELTLDRRPRMFHDFQNMAAVIPEAAAAIADLNRFLSARFEAAS